MNSHLRRFLTLHRFCPCPLFLLPCQSINFSLSLSISLSQFVSLSFLCCIITLENLIFIWNSILVRDLVSVSSIVIILFSSFIRKLIISWFYLVENSLIICIFFILDALSTLENLIKSKLSFKKIYRKIFGEEDEETIRSYWILLIRLA